MTFKAKDFERRHRLESVPRRDRGKPDDAAWDRPAARPPPVLFPVNYRLAGVECIPQGRKFVCAEQPGDQSSSSGAWHCFFA